MSDWKLIGLAAYVIASAWAGAYLLCFSIEFIGDDWEIHDVAVRWPRVIGGLALLFSAGLIAAAKWPV